MPKTVCQSVAWFKRYKTLKSVTVGRSVGRSVGSLNLRKFSYSAKTRSAFGLARNNWINNLILMLCSYIYLKYIEKSNIREVLCVNDPVYMSNYKIRLERNISISKKCANFDSCKRVTLAQIFRSRLSKYFDSVVGNFRWGRQLRKIR